MRNPDYVFPGLWPFVEKSAEAAGRDILQYGQTKLIWHVSQIQTALGQFPSMDEASQLQALRHIQAVRGSLLSALEGIDAAIAEVTRACGLTSETKRRKS